MTTPADALIEFARTLREQPRRLIVVEGGPVWGHDELARAATALKFEDADPGLKLRALIESWDWERIIRELH